MQYEPKFELGQKVYLYIPITNAEDGSQKWYLSFEFVQAILIEKEGDKLIYNYQAGDLGWYKEDVLFASEEEAEGKTDLNTLYRAN